MILASDANLLTPDTLIYMSNLQGKVNSNLLCQMGLKVIGTGKYIWLFAAAGLYRSSKRGLERVLPSASTTNYRGLSKVLLDNTGP